jgi:hypothetical protein
MMKLFFVSRAAKREKKVFFSSDEEEVCEPLTERRTVFVSWLSSEYHRAVYKSARCSDDCNSPLLAALKISKRKTPLIFD